MDDLHQYFLRQSAEKLKDLIKDLDERDAIGVHNKARIFRILHTIKGTSQTFGLNAVSSLAGKLETLLNAGDCGNDSSTITLIDGLRLLVRSLEQKDVIIPPDFYDKIPDTADDQRKVIGEITAAVPVGVLDQLSSPERKALAAELAGGKHLFGLEIALNAANFAAELRDIRKSLEAEGNIIATLPGGTGADPDQMQFQIILGTSASGARFLNSAQTGSVRVIFDIPPKTDLKDLKSVVSHLVSHGQDIAAASGKIVRFEIEAPETKLPVQRLNLLFEILLHLIRNAVDHAIEEKGTIKIELKEKTSTLDLRVADDGRGIDLNKLRAAALDRQLINAGAKLDDQQTLALIFRSEFSTFDGLSEISGRGVGLNIVKDALDAAGGSIAVKSEIDRGTVFEIVLPK